MPTVIHASGPENAVVEIHVKGAFDSPWRITVRRSGHPDYHAQCVVRARKMPSGEPLLDIVWQGERAPRAMQAILERAVSARLEDVLSHQQQRLD